MYFKIKQELTIRNFILLLQKYFKSCTIIFYLLLSISFVIVETVNYNYFNQFKRSLLRYEFVIQTILLPANLTNFIINNANTYLANKYDTVHIREQNLSTELITLQQENQQLKQLLNFVQSHNFKVVTTDLIWQIHNKTSHYGIINIGKAHGIENGQAVLNHSGLIGKIINAQENRSEILFINSEDFRTAVKIGKNGSQGIITGSYGKKNLRIGYLQEGSLISSNDSVFTSGTYPNFKGGIFVGTFEAPDSVKTEINWGSLKLVSILIPSNDENN